MYGLVHVSGRHGIRPEVVRMRTLHVKFDTSDRNRREPRRPKDSAANATNTGCRGRVDASVCRGHQTHYHKETQTQTPTLKGCAGGARYWRQHSAGTFSTEGGDSRRGTLSPKALRPAVHTFASASAAASRATNPDTAALAPSACS
jgi:hypothetical protein